MTANLSPPSGCWLITSSKPDFHITHTPPFPLGLSFGPIGSFSSEHFIIVKNPQDWANSSRTEFSKLNSQCSCMQTMSFFCKNCESRTLLVLKFSIFSVVIFNFVSETITIYYFQSTCTFIYFIIMFYMYTFYYIPLPFYFLLLLHTFYSRNYKLNKTNMKIINSTKYQKYQLKYERKFAQTKRVSYSTHLDVYEYEYSSSKFSLIFYGHIWYWVGIYNFHTG